MPKPLCVNGSYIAIEELLRAVWEPERVPVVTDDTCLRSIDRSRQVLETILASGRVVYGVNTGVGGFVDRLIPNDHRAELQDNLIAGVATNVGPPIDPLVVRAIMIARLISLARGNSAIRRETFEKFRGFINAGIVPRVPSMGSLGASGDLGPLAHIALALTGRGAVLSPESDNGVEPSATALARHGLSPMTLDFKEGLALVNGTSGMVGYAAILAGQASKLLSTYTRICALSFESMSVKAKPFHPRVHAEKPHAEQQIISERLHRILSQSALISHEDDLARELDRHRRAGVGQETPIEDAYSIRCTPQILGPVWYALDSTLDIVERELNSSNDNPLVIASENDVFHNGHFHGQYVAMAMDQLAIALTVVGNLADRRIDRLLDEKKNAVLPPFLCDDRPGIRLGLMGGQFMTTSLTAEMRSMAMPTSIQTLPSTADFQDIVSMGFVACRKVAHLLKCLEYIIAFELLCGSQAIGLRHAEDKVSPSSRKLIDAVRSRVGYLSEDVELTDIMENLTGMLREMNVNPGRLKAMAE